MSAAARAMALAAWCASVSTLAACSSRPLDFGDDPDFEWWTDHETADLRDWQGGADPHGFVYADASELRVVSDHAHSGKYALRVHGVGPSTLGWTTAIAARNGPLPADAYYTAWYYLPVALKPRAYWIYFLFRSRTDPSNDAANHNEYGLSFREGPGGTLVSVLADRDGNTVAPAGDVAVPIGSWFQISAHLRVADDASGQLSVWQDGALVFDLTGPTAATADVEWMVGGVIEGLANEPADLYVDDAAITHRRLSPADTTFSRE